MELVVVGAGLVGALWSLFLARRGFKVQLYERGPDPRITETAAGRSTHLVISARGWKSMATAGVDANIRTLCVPLEGRIIHGSDKKLSYHSYGETGQAIYAVDRSALNLALIKLALEHPNISIHFNRRCVDVKLDGPTLEFEDTSTRQRFEVAAQRVFAADGAFSRVRLAMLKKDRFDYSQHYIAYAHKELAMPEGARVLEANRTHVWPRRQLMMIAFPNPGQSFTATLIMPFEGATSFASIRTKSQLFELFDAQFPDAVPLLPQLEENFFSYPTFSAVTMRCYPWAYQDKVLLIGDAAHAMVPFLGQGMNCGFEDCSVLDALMTQHGDDWSRIFLEYQTQRKPNTDAVTELSAKHLSELAELVDDPKFRLQKAVENKMHRRHPEKFMPLYPMIAFTHIPYARARDIAAAQDGLTKHVLAYPNIEEKLDSPEVEAFIDSIVAKLPLSPWLKGV